MKANRQMTTAEKQKWDEIKERLADALTSNQALFKQDLNFTWMLHKSLFGQPNVRPKLTCCIDRDEWFKLVVNINQTYKDES